MQQLAALIWLKWTLFRNTMRSRRAAVSGAASLLGTLLALGLSLLVAAGLGTAAYSLLAFGEFGAIETERREVAGYLFLLGLFAFLYLMWAVVPLGVSGGAQFDPGRLLLYPVSLRKLFAIDWLSELTSLASIFTLPTVCAVSLAAGLASGGVARALVVAAFALSFGVAFAKLLSTSVGALARRGRTRGETVLALLGALAGFAGMLVGQIAPVVARHAETFRGLRWTPPGAAALALTEGLREGGTLDYLLSLLTLAAYTFVFVFVTYRIARRAALGEGGARRSRARETEKVAGEYAGWKLPLLSDALSAVVEKETRYALRNAQLRTIAFLPLILIAVRAMQGRNFGRGGEAAGGEEAAAFAESFARYGEGLLLTGGVLYVFLILSALACNQFAYESGGMRSFILSPLDRRLILVGKNIAVTAVAFVLSALLLVVNQLAFRDVSAGALLFTALSFVFFAATYSLIGNWLSVYFPKRMEFGKKLNASGTTGLLIIPIILVLMLAPLASVAAGYLTRSPAVKYATLAAFALVSLALYALLIGAQGRLLARRERDILEAVAGRND